MSVAVCHPERSEGAGTRPFDNQPPSGSFASLRMTRTGVGLLTLSFIRTGWAHDGQTLTPHHLWSAWSFEPAVVIGLVLTGWLYFRGIQTLWRNAGRGRGVRAWEVGAFAGGWLMLVVALV